MSPTLLSLSPLIWLVAIQFLLYAVGWGLYSLLIHEERQAIFHWVLFMLLMGVGFWLSTLRSEPRTPLPYVGSDMCFITGYIVLRRGLERYFHLRPSDRQHLVLLTGSALALMLIGPSEANAFWRTVLSYGMGSLIIGLAVKRVARIGVAEIGAGKFAVVSLPAFILVVSFLARMIHQLLVPYESFEMHLGSESNRSLLFAYLIGAAMFNFSFMALVTSRLLVRLRAQARIDPLTGLANRRTLEDAIQREWARFQRGGQGFAVLAIDLDHFKHVNDTHGHLVGDGVLQEMGKRLAAAVRRSDIVARTGGEEFIVLVPNSTREGARAEAERLRAAVIERPIELTEARVVVTLSVGVTVCDPSDSDPRQVLHRADQALYRAKADGRNRVALLPAADDPAAVSLADATR